MASVLIEPIEILELPNSTPARRPTAWRHLAALIPAAWVIVVMTHVVHLDWLLPPLILVGTASLVRGGRTLLDRLMLALALLLGGTAVAGLLLSVWPWGLNPTAVGGLALTVLVLIGVGLRRRPALPRPTLMDGLTLATATAIALYLVRPYLRTGLAGRIGLAVDGEDLARHLSVFDGIRTLGGYAFLDPHAAKAHMYEGVVQYPQGFHFTSALLDNFLRSGTTLGSGTSALYHFLGFHTVAYGMMVLTVLWATQWIAGPLLRTGARPLLALAFLAPFLLFSDFASTYALGYAGEVYGMALVVLLTAILARPIARQRTQVLAVGALLVGIGFGYYLFLPAAALGAGVVLLVHRRWLRGHGRFTVITAALTAMLALVPVAFGVLAGNSMTALTAVALSRRSRDVLLALVLAISACLLTRAGRRLRVWRRYGLVIGGALATCLAMGVYQQATDGGTGYYFEKLVHCLEIVLLVGLGALTMLAPVPRRPSAATVRRRMTLVLPVVLLAGAVGAAMGVPRGDSPFRPQVDDIHANWGRSWNAGLIQNPKAGRIIATILNEYPARPGEVTIVLTSSPTQRYSLTLFVDTLERTSGLSARILYRIGGTVLLDPASDLPALLTNFGIPAQVVTLDAPMAHLVDQVVAAHPGLSLRQVDLSTRGMG